MSIENGPETSDGAAPASGTLRSAVSGAIPRAPFAELCRKALLLVEADAAVLSHFRPVLRVLQEVARDVVVAAHDTGRLPEIEALGARAIGFDMFPAPTRPARQVAASAWAFARMIEAEQPEVLHVVGLKPAVVAALALNMVPAPRVVVHVTGLGALRFAQDRRSRFYRSVGRRLLGSLLRRPTGYLLVENKDDLALLREAAADPAGRFAILGGSGVDPDAFVALPPPADPVPVAAYVGRLVYAKGADLYMQAFDLLGGGAPVRPLLCGRCDPADADSLPRALLDDWCTRTGAVWREHVDDVREIWRDAGIYVLPARGGEGLSRAMLEAAACQRSLVVTGVPGCRDFVRNGIEGIVVPPENPQALAQALLRLAGDGALRQRLAEGARRRLLHGFTEAHVIETLRQLYAAMFMQRN